MDASVQVVQQPAVSVLVHPRFQVVWTGVVPPIWLQRLVGSWEALGLLRGPAALNGSPERLGPRPSSAWSVARVH